MHCLSQASLGNNGRLGNQLFQYAAMKCLSLHKCVPMVLPEGEHRLNDFQIKAYSAPIKQIIGIVQSPQVHTYNEPHFHYDENFFKLPLQLQTVNLHGYFQSPKYFQDIDHIIRKELTIASPSRRKYIEEYIQNIRDKYPNKSIVSLHNRRGDNVPIQGEAHQDKIGGNFLPDKEKYHPLLSDEYLSKSMKMFDNCVFLVFSDSQKDIDWCKNNIEGENLLFSEGHDDITDFGLQSACDHNIVANSSFSWWSAYLNDNPDKVVVAPKSRWFGPGLAHHNLKDLFPEEWKLL